MSTRFVPVACTVFIVVALCSAGCARTSEVSPLGALQKSTQEAALQIGPDRHVDLRGVSALYLAAPLAQPQLNVPDLMETLANAADEELLVHSIKAEVRKSAPTVPPAQGQDRVLVAAADAGADAVLITTISTYQERIGSGVAVDRPARAGFSMDIVRVADRKILWSATYHYADQALSENLFRAREKIQSPTGVEWRTAEEIVSQGFREALKAFSRARETLFIAPVG